MEFELDYQNFLRESYEECRDAEWFQDVVDACYTLDTDDSIISAIIGEIHEGLRINYSEAVKYFWTVLFINPLIAIKAYQETDLLLDKVNLYGVFKTLNPLGYVGSGVLETYIESGNFETSWNRNVVYNPSIENFMIFAMEALLQKDMNPEGLHAINDNYLGILYEHDKIIMANKNKYLREGKTLPKKWVTHRNLNHILNAIDPHHIIILLEFFAQKYGARLYKGNVGKYCYSADKYEYIIRFIKNKYGSLSEYIEWGNNNYMYHYENYFRIALQYNEMYKDIDVIFSTSEDKARMGTLFNGGEWSAVRSKNKLKNPNLIRFDDSENNQ